MYPKLYLAVSCTQKPLKLAPVIVSIILASATFGYESALADASGGFQSSAGGSTPCTASYPCAKICGDHPCAPGEVYVPGSSTSTSANATASTNSSGTSVSTQMNISANVTATKTNGTAMQGMKNGTMTNSTMENNMMANGTMTTQTMSNTNKTIASMNGTMTEMNGNMTSGTMKASSNTTVSTTTVPPPAPMQSPEKQVSSGTTPADVKCPSGYQLALNKFDSRPACVTPEVMAKLVARGWATSSP